MAWPERFPLEIGGMGKLLVREEEMRLFTHGTWPYRILYVSDIHLSRGNASKLIGQLAQAADNSIPHLILFGGDLVENHEALPALSDCVRELVSVAPLASVAGNHDKAAGIRGVQKAVEKSGGFWLGRESFSVQLGERKLRIDGQIKNGAEAGERKILCTHFPDHFPKAARSGYQLVLAGHLHGCQCVFWQRRNVLYPGAWFYRWNGLRFKNGPCSLLVSRGVYDSLPLRWNCPREVLLCRVF